MRNGPDHGTTPFGERVKQARTAKHLTARELAKECGLHHAQISGYENRGQKPGYYGLVALAQALECSLDYLCGLTEK